MVNGQAGKGDDPRKVTKKEYDKNFSRIFGKYVSPRERRIKELKKDLRECRKTIKELPEGHKSLDRLNLIIEVIQDELKDLT